MTMQRESMEKNVKIILLLEEDSWHGYSSESVWGKRRGGDLAEIDNIPAYAYGLAVCDIVKYRGNDGVCEFVELVEDGGHSTIRVIFRKYPSSEKSVGVFVERINDCGCRYESSTLGEDKLFAIDVPPDLDINCIFELLEDYGDYIDTEFGKESAIHKAQQGATPL